LNWSRFLRTYLEPWLIPEAEYKPESIYYELSKPYRLWYEYLRLSPTYWLAHKHKTGYKGGLSEDERKKLPTDFDDVIKTYEVFGDVYCYIFKIWWKAVGSNIFNSPLTPTQVDIVSKVLYDPYDINESNNLSFNIEYLFNKKDNSKINKCMSDIKEYFEKNNSGSNRADDFIILSVPIKSKKSDLIRQFETIVTEHCVNPILMSKDVNQHQGGTIYTLHGERFRLKASTVGLRLLWTTAKYRNLESWQIGALTDISKIHKFPNIHIKPKDDKEYQSRISLGSLTNRKIKSSIVVMENAARGKFSCNDEVEIPEINYQYMWQNIRRRMQANTKQYIKFKDLAEDIVDD
jgi:hypothetical protein